jgi:hypothetical protein
MQQSTQPLPSSYRDPSGFVFEKDGILYRQVNKIFKKDFDHFISSGCYDHLTKKKLLISNKEIKENISGSAEWYKTLLPEKIDYISYPYEWCFDMIKDAALLTLQLVKESISFGCMLKDATPFNIQFRNGKPVFIDTLSFEIYDASQPWIAYRQFCESFLSPLLLMHYRRQPLQSLFLSYPEGIPISITKSLLPWRSRFSFHSYLHIHIHSKFAEKNKRTEQNKKTTFSEKKMLRLIHSLEILTRSLSFKSKKTVWANYYEEINMQNDYLQSKKVIINDWMNKLEGIKTAIDLGCNDGEFTRLLSQKNIQSIAIDFDHTVINRLYNYIKNENEQNILPLLVDLSVPSPAIGVNNTERKSFIERTNVDLAFALALVHHLSIGKNIPFEKIAFLFQKLSNWLIVEFIPKKDEKNQILLTRKKDIYFNYCEEEFEKVFGNYYLIKDKQMISDSGRSLYLMKRKDA